ncbi:unnamed protein product [Rhizophagus irregularis]|nr:unnamed protein product [Rhizophagus irregularis]
MVPKKVAEEVHYSSKVSLSMILNKTLSNILYSYFGILELTTRKGSQSSGSGKKKEKFPKQVDSEDSENNPKYEQESTVNESAIEDVEVLIKSYNNSISTVDRTMLNVLDTTFLGINEFNMKKD